MFSSKDDERFLLTGEKLADRKGWGYALITFIIFQIFLLLGGKTELTQSRICDRKQLQMNNKNKKRSTVFASIMV